MPSLDYKHAVSVTGVNASVAADVRFYDGTPGRELRTCKTCRRPEDPTVPHDVHTPGCARLGREDVALKAELRQRDQWQNDRAAKARARRDAGIARATVADRAGHDRAVAIIREAAARLPEFSANAVRDALTEHGVKATLVAGAFRSAVADKVIVATDRGEQSRAESTNAHRLVIYRSCIYGKAVA